MLNLCFYWKLIWNQDTYSKTVKDKGAVFYGEFENEKKKGQNFFDLPEPGFEPRIFGNFPAHDLNFNVKWGAWDQIKTSFLKM